MGPRIPLRSLKGIGPARAAQLARHGVLTVEDLLYHLPFRYEDWRTMTPLGALEPGEQATTIVEITAVREGGVPRGHRVAGRRGGRAERILEVRARDDTGTVCLVWFHQADHMRARYKPGQRVVVHGRVEPGPRFIHPDIEIASDPASPQMSGRSTEPVSGQASGSFHVTSRRAGQLVPVYSKPTGMPGGTMRRLVRTAVEHFGERLRDPLLSEVTSRHGLMDPADALTYLHVPPPDADAAGLNGAQTQAHRTLIFDELFCFHLAMALRRVAGSRSPGIAFSTPGKSSRALRDNLPFTLTGAQQRVISEIQADMASPCPMRRVVLGDVGCGKTVVALFAALVALDAGCSAAVMTPTEVLAEQHVETFRALLSPLGIRPMLLTGALGTRERTAVLAAIASGEPVLVVGTHSLVQEKVRFERLGLAVVDEQHRFGVRQRETLRRKGRGTSDVAQATPDTLVMTATPIPRTLARTVYGDLEVSYLDELPAGRRPVTTRVIGDGDRDEAYGLTRDELAKGHQAFIVFPLVEDSEAAPLRAATTMVAELRAATFAGHAVGLLHGRMRSEEKDETMRLFKAGEYQVLVCTTVIEVGIDIPNATVMVIEHADRFGLAQLHQLRGRVGRGGTAATCYLIASSICPDSGYERLRVMEEMHDGLRIAEADLRIRGPGEFLGTRQAGLPELRVASLLQDTDLLEVARQEAMRFVEAHSDLEASSSVWPSTVLRHPWADQLDLR